MKQVILDIHLGSWHLPIYGYGLMLVIGFLIAAHWAKYLARRSGLDGEFFVNVALLALVTGIIGARASHILENLGDFTRADRTVGENLLNMINLRSGGLTYYGGFLLAFPTLAGYVIWKKIPLRLAMDIAAPCLMVALGFGRVGCFMNGCCYGA
jgi:phosphatidylglycerol:prolipoprotein diacylglycerol transferase